MIRVIIVDDDELCVSVIEDMISQLDDFICIETFQNALDAYNYLEANAMGNFYISDNSSINGGVYIGYLTSATRTTTTGGTSSTEDLEFASEDRRVDFGANFGVSLYLTKALQLDARYGHGRLSISEDEELFNRTIQFTIGLKL